MLKEPSSIPQYYISVPPNKQPFRGYRPAAVWESCTNILRIQIVYPALSSGSASRDRRANHKSFPEALPYAYKVPSFVLDRR
jgi:hypothetical protein